LLDRISLPKEEPIKASGFGLVFQSIPRFLRISTGVIGSVLIFSSLTIGTAVAALESVPGQPIYPVKKFVENVQMRMTTDEAAKVNLQIKFANNRLEELEKVLEKNKQGKVSGEEVQKLVEKTIKDVAQTTDTISKKTSEQKVENPQVKVLTKIVDLSNKQTALLQTASIQSEGRLDLGKALEESLITKERAIENIEKAGLKVEEKPIVIEQRTEDTQNTVQAKGKLTSVSATSLNIGTARFLLTKDTKFVNIIETDLKVDKLVEIKGEVREGKTYALEISAELPPKNQETKPEPEETEPTEEQQ